MRCIFILRIVFSAPHQIIYFRMNENHLRASRSPRKNTHLNSLGFFGAWRAFSRSTLPKNRKIERKIAFKLFLPYFVSDTRAHLLVHVCNQINIKAFDSSQNWCTCCCYSNRSKRAYMQIQTCRLKWASFYLELNEIMYFRLYIFILWYHFMLGFRTYLFLFVSEFHLLYAK